MSKDLENYVKEIILGMIEEKSVREEQDMNTKYDRNMNMVKPDINDCRKKVRNVLYNHDKENYLRQNINEPICLSVTEYINAIMLFAESTSECIWKDDEKMHIIRDKINNNKLEDKIPISKCGNWIDTHFTRGVKHIILSLIHEYLPCLEAFVICLCEHHSRLMHLYFDQPQCSVQDIVVKTVCHPEYNNFVKDMQFVCKYFQILSIFELPLQCQGKTNEEIIEPYKRLYKAFHIHMHLPYSISEKYADMQRKMCDESLYSHGRFEMHLRVWYILTDASLDKAQKCHKLRTLIPCKDILQPLHICTHMKIRQHIDQTRHKANNRNDPMHSLDIDLDTITEILYDEYFSITGREYMDIDFSAILNDPKDELYHRLHAVLDAESKKKDLSESCKNVGHKPTTAK